MVIGEVSIEGDCGDATAGRTMGQLPRVTRESAGPAKTKLALARLWYRSEVKSERGRRLPFRSSFVTGSPRSCALQRALCMTVSGGEAAGRTPGPRDEFPRSVSALSRALATCPSKGSAMATAFRDILLRLTEAALVADTMTSEEIAALLVEARQAIEDLRDEVDELREPREDVSEAEFGEPIPPNSRQ